ncbi:MAG: HlyD family secretion protein [Gammaproteobacteria bacterium]|nr:HlyD family secretion protein [Gammaproteobacteria bacterium]
MKRKLILALLGIAALTAVVVTVKHWWYEGRFWESTNNAYLRADITVISSRVAGPVAEVFVKDNQHVSAGDILYALDKSAYTARRDRARALVAQRTAELEHLQTRLAHQGAAINAKESEVLTARTELERTRQDLIRADVLQTKGFTDRQRYDHARTDVARAESELSRTQANLAAERAQLGVLSDEAAELKAAQELAQAELRLTEIDLYLTDVRAPTAGIVGNKQVEPGEYSQTGVRKLALVDLDDIWVSANFKETQLTKVLPGQKAVIDVDAFPDEHFAGTVESVSPASGAEFSLLPPDNATGNFTKIVQRVPVKIVLDHGNPMVARLRPGMSVIAHIDTRGGVEAANKKLARSDGS